MKTDLVTVSALL